MANHYNKETKQMILALNQQGQSIASLAREYGIAEQTIYKWKKALLPSDETGKRNPKKSYNHIHERIDDSVIFEVIDDERDEFPVRTLTRVLGVAKSTYYKSKQQKISLRSQKNEDVKKEIQKIYTDSKCRYGVPKIQKKLADLGKRVSLECKN